MCVCGATSNGGGGRGTRAKQKRLNILEMRVEIRLLDFFTVPLKETLCRVGELLGIELPAFYSPDSNMIQSQKSNK